MTLGPTAQLETVSCLINIPVVFLLFSFEVLMNHLLEGSATGLSQHNIGPKGFWRMLQQTRLEAAHVISALISLLYADSFILQAPETQFTPLHTSGTLMVLGGHSVLEHPSSNEKQQLVNKYLTSLCLGWENSEMCYVMAWRYPVAQAPVATLVNCSLSHPLLLFSFPCFTSPFPYPWFLWSDLK